MTTIRTPLATLALFSALALTPTGGAFAQSAGGNGGLGGGGSISSGLGGSSLSGGGFGSVNNGARGGTSIAPIVTTPSLTMPSSAPVTSGISTFTTTFGNTSFDSGGGISVGSDGLPLPNLQSSTGLTTQSFVTAAPGPNFTVRRPLAATAPTLNSSLTSSFATPQIIAPEAGARGRR